MPQTNRTTVVGVFNDRDQAERSIDELHRIGFRDDQIGFAWKGQGSTASTSRGEVASETSDKVGGGLATGAVVGGILGAAAALLIPGVGPVIAGGILAPLLGVGATAAGVAAAGALAGAAAGGLVGALAGLGIPEEEARYYENEFNQGRVLVTVKADNRYDEVSAILRRHGAYDIESQGGQRNVADTEPNRSPIASTPHNVEKKQTTERQNVSDTVRREEVHVDRNADRKPMSGETTSDWSSVSSRYRTNWQTRYGTSGGRWEDVEPAYRFGYDSHNDPRYRGRSYDEIEPDLRQDWESRGHTGDYSAWDRVRGFFRDIWNDAR